MSKIQQICFGIFTLVLASVPSYSARSQPINNEADFQLYCSPQAYAYDVHSPDCDRYRQQRPVENRQISAPKPHPQLANAKVVEITEDWRSDDPDLPWSELLLIRSDFGSPYYVVFDRNYRKSGGILSLGIEFGYVTRWTAEEIDVYVYLKTGCDAILGCHHQTSQPVGKSLEVMVGSEVFTLYGDNGTFPISPQLKSAFTQAKRSTPVSIRINNETINDIGKKTVEQLSILYSVRDRLEDTAISERLALKQPLSALSSAREIARHAVPSVVSIDTPYGSGTGFIVSESGLILTNRHVVSRSANPYITLYDGTKVEGRVLKRDSFADVALVKIDAAQLKALPLCYKQYPFAGEDVTVIGNPLSYSTTVTQGIVSGIRQTENQTLIQTDAPINPGNSGGPILNQYGEVIGIVNQKLSGIGIEGIGFAVSIINALKNLGIQIETSETLNVSECGNPLSEPLSSNPRRNSGKEQTK